MIRPVTEQQNQGSTDDDRAVSPVLGVALLIAITVILAGVVGFIAIGVSTGGAETPDAEFQFDYDSGAKTLDVVHIGGDRIPADEVEVVVTGSGTAADPANDWSSDMTAGNTETIATSVESGDTVRLVWDAPDTDRTTIIVEHTIE